MKNNGIVLLVLMLIGLSLKAQQQLVHYWHFNSFTGLSAATEPVNITPYRADFSVIDTGLAKVYYATLQGTSSAYKTYWDASTGDTVNLRLGVVAGNCLRLRNPSDSMQLNFHIPSTNFKNISIRYTVQKSSAANGAANNIFAYSVDSGLTWRTSGLSQTSYTVTNYSGGNPAWPTAPVSVNITDTAAFNNPNLMFRITFAGAGSTGTSGNNRIDNFSVDGDTIVYPTIYLTHSLSTFLTSKNGTSDAQQIAVSGVGLLDTVWLNSNGTFKISLTQNGVYTNTLFILTQNNLLSSTPVFIKFSPIDTGTFIANLSASSLMADTLRLALKGSTLPLPVITVSSLPLFMFVKTEEQIIPNVQTFVITTQNLTDTLFIKSNPPFYISVDTVGGLISKSDLFFTESNIAQKTIYVWFDAIMFNTFADSITISSAGAATQQILINGKFLQTPVLNIGGLPIDTFANITVGNNSATQSFILTAQGLTAPLTLTVPKPFSIALPGEEFKNQFTINADSGKINKLVYIKFNPTQLGDVNDSLVITSLDLDTEIVPLFGTTFDPFKGLNTIYSQNFTGATNNQPPAGWLISDTLLWSIVSSNPSANYAYASGTNCLRFDNEASELPKTATATVSGKINAQFYKDIKVIWGARRTNNFFNGIIKGKAFLFCSINGTNWDTVYYTPEPNNSDLWSYVNGGNLIALPSSCNHISDVQLRWQFTGEGLGSSGTYRMDDIRVFGTLDTLTGFVETTANISSLSCYPVPANGNQITFNANEPLASIVLLDMLGKQVAFEINHNSQNIILPIQKINQGVYLASVTSVKGVTQIKRIIITR